MRVLAALLAGIVGAIAGAGALGMGLAYLFTAIWGSFEGSAAMGGFSIGMPLGGIIGLVLGPCGKEGRPPARHWPGSPAPPLFSRPSAPTLGSTPRAGFLEMEPLSPHPLSDSNSAFGGAIG